MSFLLSWSILSFIGINYASTALAVSNRSTLAPKDDAAASITPGAAINPSSESLLQASASCFTCRGTFIVDDYSWWDKTQTRIAATIILVVDNSTNITSTSIITSKPPPEEIGSVYAFAVSGETVFLTYPTSYNVLYLFEREIASLAYVTSVNGSLIEPYYTCTLETSLYSNIFAFTAGTGEVLPSSYKLFASSLGILRSSRPDCTFVQWGAPHILTPVSLLTATSTSFGSFPRTPTIEPSPPSRPDLPVASSTEFKPSKPTQDIPNNTLQEKPPETTQAAIPATLTAIHEGSSRPKEIQPVPNERVPIQNPNERPEESALGNAEESVNPLLETRIGKGPFSANSLAPSPMTTPWPILTFGDTIIIANGQNKFIVGSQTVVPGGPAVWSSGTPTVVVIAGSTIELAASKPSIGVGAAVFTLPGNQIITANNVAKSEYIIKDHTLTPGGTITVSGTPIFLAPSASEVIIGSQTIHLQPLPPSPQPITIGGQTLTDQSDKSGYIIDDQTLTPGGTITVSGTPIYLAPSASEVIIGSQTVHPKPLSPSPQRIIIGGQTLTAQSDKSGYIIDDQTLTPGGTITVSGTPIFLAPSASEVIIGSQTVQLQPPTPFPQPITIDGQPLTAQSDRSGYIINGQTIQPGSLAITIAGKSVFLAPSMSALIIDGSSTIPLITAFPALTIAGEAIAPKSTSEYIIDGQTLRPGYPAITVSGIAISLAPSASALVIGGTKTSPLLTPGAASTSQPGLGDLILGVFNSATTTENAPQAFPGRATSVRSYPERSIFIIIIVIGICSWV